MKIGSETRRQEDNVHRHLQTKDKQIHTVRKTWYEENNEKEIKGKKEREREREENTQAAIRIKVYNRWKELTITEILSCLSLLFLLS